MSQSPFAAATPRPEGQSSTSTTEIHSESRVEALLDALNDDDCQAILDATTGRALSASELSETCELPLSTTYRKLDILSDTGLVDERTRIGRSGQHASEYVRLVDDVVVSLTQGGREVTVVQRDDNDHTAVSGLTADD